MKILLSEASLFDCFGFDTHPTETRIRSFSALGAGWHYGEGSGFALDVQNAALSMNALAVELGLIETDAFPGIDGGILLTICHGDHYIEFRVETDCRVSFCRELNDQEIEDRAQLSLDEAKQVLRNFRKETCGQSESFTFSTSILRNDASHQRHLSCTGEAFPLSARNAPWRYPETSVDTYDDFTSQELPASRQSTGGLIQKTYLLATG